MKKINNLLILFLAMFLFVGCSFNINPTPNPDDDQNIDKPEDNQDTEKPGGDILDNGNTPPIDEKPDGLEDYKLDTIDSSLTFSQLFDINNIIKINIDIDDSQLEKLEDDYIKYSSSGGKSPIYRKCNFVEIEVIVGGDSHYFKYYDVGVRMKGNTSRHSFYNNGEVTSNIHLKLSFEETFDDSSFYEEVFDWSKYSSESRTYRKNRKFMGMSKIDLRYNKCEDASYIKEYYANEMYRSFGVISSHTNFSQVTLNYKNKTLNYGIYLLTEPLSKTLIKRSLSSEESYINTLSWDLEKNGTYGVSGSSYGQLYKASYGSGRADLTSTDSHLFGVGSSDGYFTPTYELKTNTKEPLDHSQLKNVINTLNNGNLDDISKVIDLEYFAMFEAINTILGGPDDIRNNYNNYAMYIRKSDNRLIFIPIDLDRVLGVSKDFDPTGSAMANVSPFEKRSVGANCDQVNQLYNKTILQDNYVRQMYIENLKTIYNSKWVDPSYFASIFAIVKAHYQDFAKTSMCNVSFDLNERYKENSSNMSFSDYISRKVELIKSIIEVNEISLIAGLSNFYLTGTFDNWNKTTEEYKFTKVSDNIYEYAFTIKDSNFSLKVYNKDKSMWLRSENGAKLHEGGENINFSNCNVGGIIVFRIDTSSGTLSWNIK